MTRWAAPNARIAAISTSLGHPPPPVPRALQRGVAHPHMLGEKIDERAHARGQGRGVADIDRMDVFAVAGIVALPAPARAARLRCRGRCGRGPGGRGRRRRGRGGGRSRRRWRARPAAAWLPRCGRRAGTASRRGCAERSSRCRGARRDPPASSACRGAPGSRARRRRPCGCRRACARPGVKLRSGPTRIATSARSSIRSISVSVSTMSSVTSGCAARKRGHQRQQTCSMPKGTLLLTLTRPRGAAPAPPRARPPPCRPGCARRARRRPGLRP